MEQENKKQLAAVVMLSQNYKNRKMIIQLAQNDFKTRYAGSYFGVFWAFVQPVVTILLYWFVFQVGFRSGSVGEYPFVLWLTAGLVPWFFFSDAWNGAASALTGYSFLVKKVLFDIEILPAIKVISAFMINIFFTLFMLVLFMVSGYYPSIHVLQLVYCLICTIAITWGLGCFTSAIVVFVRDLSHFLNVALQVLMWLTPIMWNYSMISKYPVLQIIMKLNPVFYIVQGYRDAVFHGPWFWQRPLWTIYFWGLTIVIFILGSSVFRQLKPHFADVL